MSGQLQISSQAKDRILARAQSEGITPKEVVEKALQDIFGGPNRVIMDFSSTAFGNVIEIRCRPGREELKGRFWPFLRRWKRRSNPREYRA